MSCRNVCAEFAPRRCWGSAGASRQIICAKNVCWRSSGAVLWLLNGRSNALGVWDWKRWKIYMLRATTTGHNKVRRTGARIHSLGANRSSPIWKTCVSSHILSASGWPGRPHTQDDRVTISMEGSRRYGSRISLETCSFLTFYCKRR